MEWLSTPVSRGQAVGELRGGISLQAPDQGECHGDAAAAVAPKGDSFGSLLAGLGGLLTVLVFACSSPPPLDCLLARSHGHSRAAAARGGVRR